MRGGYDLYGKYYANVNDALNAELAQCNEIDNRINAKKMASIERQLYEQQRPSNNEEIQYLWEKIKDLEDRINKLETK
jgi:hypothetical protein